MDAPTTSTTTAQTPAPAPTKAPCVEISLKCRVDAIEKRLGAMEKAQRGNRQEMRMSTQGEMYNKFSKSHPDFLTKSWYKQVTMEKKIWEMTEKEKLEAFQKTVGSMQERIKGGEKPGEVYYDTTEARLFSGAVQGIFTISTDPSERVEDAKPEAVENLLATGLGSWGIGLVLDLLRVGLNKDTPLYLSFKKLDIQSVSLTVANFPSLSKVAGTVNLRPTECMFAEVVCAVIREYTDGKEVVVELTEYTDDDYFEKFFGTAGTLEERLVKTLLPVLETMKEKGVRIWVDDVKPKAVYKYDDEKKHEKGVKIEDHYATVAEMVFDGKWRNVFERVKFSAEWVIHAFDLSKTTAPDYEEIPLYKNELKVKPAYVAGVQGLRAPQNKKEAVEQLKTLQVVALRELKAYTIRAKEACRLPPVFEASLTNEIVIKFPWVRECAQQGGILFELKSEPATLQCPLESIQSDEHE